MLDLKPVTGRANTYTIVNEHSGTCLDVSGASTADGAAVIQWTCNGATNQTFTLKPVTALGNSKDYQLVAEHSGKCVHVSGISTDPGSKIHQWTFDPAAPRTYDQPVGLGNSGVEDAGAAAADFDHDRAELGAPGADVLGDVVERLARTWTPPRPAKTMGEVRNRPPIGTERSLQDGRPGGLRMPGPAPEAGVLIAVRPRPIPSTDSAVLTRSTPPGLVQFGAEQRSIAS